MSNSIKYTIIAALTCFVALLALEASPLSYPNLLASQVAVSAAYIIAQYNLNVMIKADIKAAYTNWRA